ncbi:hypothetical protein LAZ40_09205 [Cereibacter sphaeroides]|uniref:hypothetical protein n=1 Tax=Cereibacter sphaeroides TaxID=1063 RepID=UPI001F203622|nr:hypothetical protein [Cereibacter sphaeroides]MCE6959228.1 hypothetical protein [Cereibacter sphaeroides]MCE6972031.1 hypothetical protein [Cereibacter sphaeroides]
MHARWQALLDATRSAADGSWELDRLIWAVRRGHCDGPDLPHYVDDYWEEACREGGQWCSTKMEDAVAMLDELAEGCDLTLSRSPAGWTAEAVHPGFGLSFRSEAPRPTAALAVVEAAVMLRGPWNEKQLESWSASPDT